MTSVSSSTSTSTTSVTSSSVSSITDQASTNIENIDWDAIIEAAYEAKLSRADTLETKVTENEAKISAYEEAQSLLADLTEAAQALRAPSGTIDSGDDVFQARTAYLTGNGGVAADDVVAITAEDGAATGSWDLKIYQLAKAHKVASESFETKSDDLGLSGTITLGTDAGGSAAIAIDADMSLADIADAINDVSETSGVTASVVKVSSTEYTLVLSSASTGETITATDGGGVLASLGVLDDAGAFADELQAAQDAIFSIDGVTMTRDTNDVDDAIEGLTFHLYAVTSETGSDDDTSVTVEVGTNLSDVKEAIVAFVDAYNAYREFALTQQETSSSGGASEESVLFGDGTLRSINSGLADALGISIDDETLALLGISFEDDNTLTYDEDTLDDALLDGVEAIQALFSYSFEPSSSDFLLLSRGTTDIGDFTLDVEVDAEGNLTAASIGGDTSLFTVSGTRIVGAEGSIYEGFTFVFVGGESTSISVETSVGIAEALYNVAEAASNDSTGSLQNQIDTLSEKNDDYEDQIDDITSRAEDYKETITARYAEMQAAISEAQSMLDYLEALMAANSD